MGLSACSAVPIQGVFWALWCAAARAAVSADGAAQDVFRNPARLESSWEWCDCGSGRATLRLWPEGSAELNRTVTVDLKGEPQWFAWPTEVSVLQWQCDGSENIGRTAFQRPARSWSAQLSVNRKGLWPVCGKDTGRLRFVSWEQAEYFTSVPYTSGESGYFCIKIPVLLRLAGGELLAIAEARHGSCSDFAWTDLVVKSSSDDGRSWSNMRIIRSEPHMTIGNAAPLQLSPSAVHPGRILVPHTRNNSDVWMTHSDDGGKTWSEAWQIPNTKSDGWTWVGTGPPGSLELSSGRLVVPSYHGHTRGNLLNNYVHGHLMFSDDFGETWSVSHIGDENGPDFNENQVVELRNGSLLSNARSLAVIHNEQRLQSRSDDGGITWTTPHYVPELPQPIDGCEGSIVYMHEVGMLLYSGPDSKVLREGMALWMSKDEGATWPFKMPLDSGLSGYSSLQTVCPKAPASGGSSSFCEALLLYEQSDEVLQNIVMVPDRFIFRRIPMNGSMAHQVGKPASSATVGLVLV